MLFLPFGMFCCLSFLMLLSHLLSLQLVVEDVSLLPLGPTKPAPAAPLTEKQRFIVDKYVSRSWVEKVAKEQSQAKLWDAVDAKDIRCMRLLRSCCWLFLVSCKCWDNETQCSAVFGFAQPLEAFCGDVAVTMCQWVAVGAEPYICSTCSVFSLLDSQKVSTTNNFMTL